MICRTIGMAALYFMFVAPFGSPATGAEKASLNREIRGTVVDVDRRPVPHAEVICSAYLPGRFPPITIRSDAKGKFAMTVPPADEFGACPDRIWAFAPGYSVAFCSLPSSQTEQASVLIVLSPRSSFRIKVTQADGKPAQNVRISVRVAQVEVKPGSWPQWFDTPETLAARTAAVTDERGVAALPAWSHQDIEILDVAKPGYGRHICRRLEPRLDTWNITLLPVGKLRGRVVADGPYPVQGLSLWIHTVPLAAEPLSTGATRDVSIMNEVIVATDSEGHFEIPELAFGYMNIAIRDGQNKPYQYRAEKVTEFHSGTTGDFEVRLRKAVHVRGVFSVMGANKRASQFRIWGTNAFLPEGHGLVDTPHDPTLHRPTFFANIDDDGRFDFYSLPGDVLLYVVPRRDPELCQLPNWSCMSADGEDHFYRLPGTSWRRRDTRKEDTKEPVLDRHAMWRVTVSEKAEEMECPPMKEFLACGRVLDHHGKPVPGVRFCVVAGGNCAEGSTDEVGRYRVWLDQRPIAYAFCFAKPGDEADLPVLRINSNIWTFETSKLLCGVIPDVVLPQK